MREAARVAEPQPVAEQPPAIEPQPAAVLPHVAEPQSVAEQLPAAEPTPDARRTAHEQPRVTIPEPPTRRQPSNDRARRDSTHEESPRAPAADRRQHARRAGASRGPAFVAGGAVLALIPSLMIASPANAVATLSPEQLQATIANNTKVLAQKLAVSANVSGDKVHAEDYVAGALAGIVAAESGPDGSRVAVSVAEALQTGGAREKIVEKALTYLGDPYALGGVSHDGIDCSGLTMVSYATVGVSLAHYVPSQDAVATTISQAEAQPGDLVFFDDEEHVALYLGGGMIIEAPDYGIPVRIVSLSSWSYIGYHFGRILNG
jgi:cell wall-associated NlpC family hydrolase